MKQTKFLRVKVLSRELYPCGKIYFEIGRRMFVNDISYCKGKTCENKPFIVHNNWIVSKAAKIYRFKEIGLWTYDKDEYYSSISQKYILYNNSKDFGNDTIYYEKMALKTALTMGKILNRAVILPKFHCHLCINVACKQKKDKCAFNSHFNVKIFDTFFEGLYRENSFLNHNKVPRIITKSLSPKIYIVIGDHEKIVGRENNTLVFVANKSLTVDEGDIVSWLGQGPTNDLKILNFDSLYFSINFTSRSWNEKLNNALKPSNYRQSERT